MEIHWLEDLIIPVIKFSFITGILGYIFYILYKAFHNAWTKQTKFFFKYKIPFFKKPYPEETVAWCMDCINKGIGYYDVKKTLLIKMYPEERINETLWIYDNILDQLNKETMKGGNEKNGNRIKGVDCEIKTRTGKKETARELPKH